MHAILKKTMALAAVVLATQASAQVTFFENDHFQGRSFTTESQVNNFERFGFNDRASSAIVQGDRREVCEDARFEGRCVILRPGRYPSLAAMGLNDRISSVRTVSRNARIDDNRYAPAPPAEPAYDNRAPQAAPQVTFYEQDGFRGRSFNTGRQVNNFQRYGFNDLASSVVVLGGRWEVCEDVRFTGRCVVLRPGRYPSLAAMGLNDRVSSVRAVGANARIADDRYAPPPPEPVYDNRRRQGERLFEATVTSVRAVVGTPQQRCWIEREQVGQERTNSNVPGAIAGALIGGILGHQVGGGTGKDIATAGGAVAGAVVGSNIGRNSAGQQVATQDVQRCAAVPNQAPDYWDVTYNFQGQEHRIQMTTPPGPTVTVNRQGEPRN